jgi:hypothetical protein
LLAVSGVRADPPNYPAAWGKNYLSANSGAKVISNSPMENDNYGAHRLIDNNISQGGNGPYCSWMFGQNPAYATYQLSGEVTIGRVAFVNEQRAEVNFHAKEILVEVSMNGQAWSRLGKFTLEKRPDLQSFAVAKALPARFVKVTIESTHGAGDYTILEEMAVFGVERARMTKEEYAAILAQIVKSAPPAVDIKCTYRFYNLDRQEDFDLIQHTIRYYSKDGAILNETAGNDPSGRYTQFDFILPGIDRLIELRNVLPLRKSKTDKEAGVVVFEEFTPQYTANYRTVAFSGSLRTVVRFKVTPKSTLYYSIEPDKEIRVPDEKIDPEGNAQVEIRIPKNRDYVYGRIVFGNTERFLRINADTGRSEEISRETYLDRK